MLTPAKRSESYLLGLVDTPGTPAGSLSEPQIRGGVSKARISFATERIKYWVSDPINSGSARMEVRLGAPRAPELLSEPPRRAKKVALRNVWGKRYGTLLLLGSPPQYPRHGPSRDSRLRDQAEMANAPMSYATRLELP